MRALVLRTDHLGDAILTTPLIRALSKGGYEVDCVLRRPLLDLFRGNPFVTGLHGIEDLCPGFDAGEWLPLARWMRRGKYDALLLPFAWPRRLLLASLFSGIPRRIASHSQFWGLLTLHECPRLRLARGDRDYASALLELSARLGVAPDGNRAEIVVPPGDEAWAAARLAPLLAEGRKLVVLHPGTGGSSCNPSPRLWGEVLAGLLRETSWNVVLTGTERERALVAGWDAALLASPRLWNAMGELSLGRLAALLRHPALLLSAATGPMHVAGALGVPTLSMFCSAPTLCPAVWAPRSGAAAHALVPPPELCRGYSSRRRNICDYAGKFSAREIVAAARRIVDGTASPE